MKLSKRIVLSVVAVLAVASLALAQSISGDLVGTIYDQTGAAVPNAAITVTNMATGVATNTVSNSTGQYRVGNLSVGTYKLSITAAGFTKAEVNSVPIELNKVVTANVTLQVGQAATAVEVTAVAATIDTTTDQLQTTFETKQMSDLPVTSVGGGIYNLSLLSAGVSSSGTVGVGYGPSVGGQRPRNNNYTIEGVDNNSKSVTGPLVGLPNDAVAEFTMLTNQFSPEYGHSTGGQFNQVIKSGTNGLHGTAYEYLQNRNLNAIDQQSIVNKAPNPRTRYDNNRFGGNVGGPIRKDKLFFFGGYERQPIGREGSGGLIYAPTSAGYDALAGIPGVSQNNLSILKQYLTTSGGQVDSLTVGGQTIPLGQLSISAPNYANYTTWYGSVDYNISTNDSLRGRVIVNRNGLIDTAANLPVFFMTIPANNYLATISEFHNFTPSLTNEFRLGFNRNIQDYPVGSQKFPGLDAFPNVTIDDLNVNIGPDPNAPQDGIQNTYQVVDNVSWLKGAHSLKFGVDARKLIAPQDFTQRVRGDYDWPTLESYLLDEVPGFAERTTGAMRYYGDQTMLGLFVNDDWKVMPHFTLNIGVRYERTTVPYSERLQTVNAIANEPGLITFGEPKVYNKGFMPRIGFAWSPGTRGNTSIRGGFGMGLDQLFDNLGLLSMPPQFQVTVDCPGNSACPTSNFLANGGIKANATAEGLDKATARAWSSGYVPDQQPPRSYQWNLGIQHVFHENYTVEARYVGTKGTDLPVQNRLNVQNVVTPQNALPTYLTNPGQPALDGLTNTLANLNNLYNAEGFIVPAYLAAGFDGSYLVGFMPYGSSVYHGLDLQLTRRFSNGLQFVGAYTWSHNIDDSTAEVFSTVTTPRRQQDFRNLGADRSDSALDHRNRFTLMALYDMPFFKSSTSWAMKNLVGNWEIAPVITLQTGNWGTVQSSVDSNMNGDNAGDRAFLNPKGDANIGSGVTALKNSNGDTVAYLANNPNARYIRAGAGAISTAGRNTLRMPPIRNLDLSVYKRFNFTENKQFEFGAQFTNFMNHPQYTGGYLSDAGSVGYTGAEVRNYLTPSSALFAHPDQVFSSNPRSIQLSAKFRF